MLGRHSGVAEMTARLVFSLKLTRLIFAKLRTLQYDFFENQFVGIIAHNPTQPHKGLGLRKVLKKVLKKALKNLNLLKKVLKPK